MGNKPAFITEEHSKYLNKLYSSDLKDNNDNDFVQNLKKEHFKQKSFNGNCLEDENEIYSKSIEKSKYGKFYKEERQTPLITSYDEIDINQIINKREKKREVTSKNKYREKNFSNTKKSFKNEDFKMISFKKEIPEEKKKIFIKQQPFISRNKNKTSTLLRIYNPDKIDTFFNNNNNNKSIGDLSVKNKTDESSKDSNIIENEGAFKIEELPVIKRSLSFVDKRPVFSLRAAYCYSQNTFSYKGRKKNYDYEYDNMFYNYFKNKIYPINNNHLKRRTKSLKIVKGSSLFLKIFEEFLLYNIDMITENDEETKKKHIRNLSVGDNFDFMGTSNKNNETPSSDENQSSSQQESSLITNEIVKSRNSNEIQKSDSCEFTTKREFLQFDIDPDLNIQKPQMFHSRQSSLNRTTIKKELKKLFENSRMSDLIVRINSKMEKTEEFSNNQIFTKKQSTEKEFDQNSFKNSSESSFDNKIYKKKFIQNSFENEKESKFNDDKLKSKKKSSEINIKSNKYTNSTTSTSKFISKLRNHRDSSDDCLSNTSGHNHDDNVVSESYETDKIDSSSYLSKDVMQNINNNHFKSNTQADVADYFIQKKSLRMNNLEQSYQIKKISSKLWVKNNNSSTHNCIIIFDWDDTLFYTSFLSQNSLILDLYVENMPEQTSSIFKQIESVVYDILVTSLAKGDTYIISNSSKGWVEYSCGKYFPTITKLLERICIISSRSEYEEQYPKNYKAWKIESFKDLVKKYNTNLVTNIISIGDSTYEIEAAHVLGSSFKESYVKTIKFKANPTPKEMYKQLTMLQSKFGEIYSLVKNLNMKVEKKDKTKEQT